MKNLICKRIKLVGNSISLVECIKLDGRQRYNVSKGSDAFVSTVFELWLNADG